MAHPRSGTCFEIPPITPLIVPKGITDQGRIRCGHWTTNGSHKQMCGIQLRRPVAGEMNRIQSINSAGRLSSERDGLWCQRIELHVCLGSTADLKRDRVRRPLRSGKRTQIARLLNFGSPTSAYERRADAEARPPQCQLLAITGPLPGSGLCVVGSRNPIRDDSLTLATRIGGKGPETAGRGPPGTPLPRKLC